MACFLVPAAEAAIMSMAAKKMKENEKEEAVQVSLTEGTVEEATKIRFSTKLGWLNKMLLGGSALLAFEHVWHGEVIPVFPFLTAVKAGEAAGMLKEMGTVGVLMTVVVTGVWGIMVAVSSAMEKKAIADAEAVREEA